MAETNEPAGWAKAKRMAEGVVDHGMDGPLRTYFLLYLPVGTILCVGLGFFGSNLLLGNEPWAVDLALGFTLAMFGTLAGGLVYVGRRIKPKVSMARTSPLYGLEKPEQKAIRRQIQGKTPPVPEQLTVARGAAVETRYTLARQLVFAPAYPFLCAAQIMIALQGSRGLWLLFWIPLLLLFAGVFVTSAWQFRRMGAFLDGTRATANQDAGEPA